eukprot:3584474-Pyramimonas_sp.AAC.1
MIWLSPPCRVFSTISRISRAVRDPFKWKQAVTDGVNDLILCMRMALYQSERGRYFAFEHPLFASTWATK